MKDKLEAKLKTLKENQATVETQIIKGQELLRKAQADLNAILGAIQVVDQLLEDTCVAIGFQHSDQSCGLSGPRFARNHECHVRLEHARWDFALVIRAVLDRIIRN